PSNSGAHAVISSSQRVPVAPASRSPVVAGTLALALLAGGGFGAYRYLLAPSAVGRAAAPPTASAAASPPAPPPPAASPGDSAAAAPLTECPAGMALVPGGRFFMGSDEPELKLSQPVHKVTVDTFCIDIYEVTAGDYKACSDVGDCRKPEAVPD